MFDKIRTRKRDCMFFIFLKNHLLNILLYFFIYKYFRILHQNPIKKRKKMRERKKLKGDWAAGDNAVVNLYLGK